MAKERTWEVETGDPKLSVVTETQLHNMDEEDQCYFMRQWFLSRYENPFDAGRPMEDGEVMHFWGGPYDPSYELMSEFERVVPDEVIEKLADEFAGECHEWDGVEDASYINEVFPNHKFYRNFCQSLDDVKALLSVQIPAELESTYCRVLCANIIVSM